MAARDSMRAMRLGNSLLSNGVEMVGRDARVVAAAKQICSPQHCIGEFASHNTHQVVLCIPINKLHSHVAQKVRHAYTQYMC